MSATPPPAPASAAPGLLLSRDGVTATVRVGDVVPLVNGNTMTVLRITPDHSWAIEGRAAWSDLVMWRADGCRRDLGLTDHNDIDIAALAEQQAAARPAPGVGVERLRALVAKATPGPWRMAKGRTLLHIGGDGPVCSISVSANHVHEDYPGCKRAYVERQEANAALIVAAVNALPALPALLAPADGAVTLTAAQVVEIGAAWAAVEHRFRWADGAAALKRLRAALDAADLLPAPPAALPADEGERT